LLGKCLLKYIIIRRKLEEKIQMTGRRGKKGKQLLHDLQERTGCRKLKEESTVWRTRFGRGCGPVVRQTVE
jgi:hypothetical protein